MVGASAREGAFGQRLLRAIRANGYAGRVMPVNPGHREIEGLACHPSLAELPELPDLVAFAISDARIEAALAEAAALGVPAAAIFGRGHEPEAAAAGPDLPARLGAIARGAGMAVCGGNCMGFLNMVDRLAVSAGPPPMAAGPGTVGLVSHSGSTWSGLLGNQRGIRYSHAVSAGQEIATTVADYVRFLAAQPETRVIGCVLETLRDPEGFLGAAAAAAARGIPVAVLKIGRSELGRQFTLAHSGALSGAQEVFAAAMERAGVISTDSIAELEDVLALFSGPRRAAAGGVGIVTDSGGERQLIVDTAEAVGMELPRFGAATRARLEAVLDPGMTPDNPVDSYGDGQVLLEDSLALVAADEAVGAAVLATNLVAGRPYADLCTEILGRVQAGTGKPVALLSNVASAASLPHAVRLQESGVPVLLGTESGLRALGHFCRWRPAEAPPAPPALPGIADLLAARGAGPALPVAAASRLMDRFGLPHARRRFVGSAEAAAAAAAEIGFPVVMKTANPAILHKTEHGGVVLGIADAAAAARAHAAIAARCGPAVEVAEQVAGGVELILGMTADPDFGPAITLGLGGVWTELMQDAVTLLPPVSEAGARAALARLRGFALLTGYRGAPAADLAALCRLIAGFSEFCAVHGRAFAEIDLNPVKAGPGGAVIVDQLFVVKGRGETA
ncbi:acetate--CoA ligase family protein [Paralimibaculum aggregatum]|uniref:Acetate--CoA ligase family protein n=1 Tax=Paralimibaculum aggregatum TaxID=3036245 RepID=A0ABQ6LST0_9RHOB|nr:acetate--CoA ligase family protein [Limibaculum sp. NKW23]